MKKVYQIIVLLVIGCSLSSCYYDTFPEEVIIDPPNPDEDVSYMNDIMPLWNADCISCHKGTIPPDLRDEFSYNSLIDGGFVVRGDAESSILYKSLLGIDGIQLMPPDAQWPDAKIAWVKEWIDQGAEDN